MTTNEITSVQTDDAAVAKILELLQEWYTDRMRTLTSLHGADPLTINIGGGEKITLGGNDLLHFRLGLSVAEQIIGKFPLRIEAVEPLEDGEDYPDEEEYL